MIGRNSRVQRTKNRHDLVLQVSAKRKRDGNIKLYVSVTFKKYGNVEFRPV